MSGFKERVEARKSELIHAEEEKVRANEEFQRRIKKEQEEKELIEQNRIKAELVHLSKISQALGIKEFLANVKTELWEDIGSIEEFDEAKKEGGDEIFIAGFRLVSPAFNEEWGYEHLGLANDDMTSYSYFFKRTQNLREVLSVGVNARYPTQLRLKESLSIVINDRSKLSSRIGAFMGEMDTDKHYRHSNIDINTIDLHDPNSIQTFRDELEMEIIEICSKRSAVGRMPQDLIRNSLPDQPLIATDNSLFKRIKRGLFG